MGTRRPRNDRNLPIIDLKFKVADGPKCSIF